MPSAYGKEFDAAVRRLRRSGFTDRPFRVQTLPAKELPGLFGDYGDGLIRIVRGLTWHVAVEVLLHEYAHHVDREPGQTIRNHHRASWGATYGRILEWYDAP